MELLMLLVTLLNQLTKSQIRMNHTWELYNLQFREYPIDDDEKVETYCRESDAFEQYVIEFINSHWDEHHPLKELNPNHHYMSNSYGDTIQVHFNDESLFIIITMTGQY